MAQVQNPLFIDKMKHLAKAAYDQHRQHAIYNINTRLSEVQQ